MQSQARIRLHIWSGRPRKLLHQQVLDPVINLQTDFSFGLATLERLLTAQA